MCILFRRIHLVVLTASIFCCAYLHADTKYILNAGDRLSVFVWNEDDLSGDLVVDPQGYVSVPLAGTMRASGLTTIELAEKFSDAFGNYLRDRPIVTVSIDEVAGNSVFVIGQVKSPGTYIMAFELDVMQALALAGGVTPFADEGSIKILRRDAEGVQRAINFNYAKVKSGKSLDTNILLQAGDIVVVR